MLQKFEHVQGSDLQGNALVQGDIEAVAGKQPMDLTRLFESISGSDAYKADYEKYDAEMKEAQERFAFVQSKKKTTAAEKRQKKEQKAEAEKHIKMQEQLVTSSVVLLPFSAPVFSQQGIPEPHPGNTA